MQIDVVNKTKRQFFSNKQVFFYNVKVIDFFYISNAEMYITCRHTKNSNRVNSHFGRILHTLSPSHSSIVPRKCFSPWQRLLSERLFKISSARVLFSISLKYCSGRGYHSCQFFGDKIINFKSSNENVTELKTTLPLFRDKQFTLKTLHG